MLHPQATELMEYAKRAGAKVGLITNGSLFTEDSLRRLLEANVDMIEFSVDSGDPQTYTKVRKGLDWDVLVRNVRLAGKLRDKIHSSSKIIASCVQQQDVDLQKAESFWGGLVDEFQKRKYLTWGINDPFRTADPEPYLPPEERIPCPFLFERLNIDSRGKVMVCGFDIAAKTNMGNVHEQTIKQIWHGEGFQYYRDKHLQRKGQEIEFCQNCPDWKYRSWKHNYWKIVKNAEKKRRQKIGSLKVTDTEGCASD